MGEANLASFVAKRPDLFGSVDEQIREAAEAGAEAAARDAGADAGPAHTMVPPTAQLTGGAAGSGAKAALPSGSGGTTTTLAGLTAGGAAGPVTGVSTINARLPSAALPPPTMAPPQSGPPQLMAAEEDDSEDEPDAKKPRLDDGSLIHEMRWAEKHPMPIQIIVQVNLGSDAQTANVPSMIPLELTVRNKF